MENINNVRTSFTQQAGFFASAGTHLTKKEYIDFMINSVDPSETDSVLEAASGTCICGRALAPHVKAVTCLDITPAMLEAGRNLAAEDNLTNISFTEGSVDSMPFEDETFDIVITRLSFHHFSDVIKPFQEMKRVLKKCGKLVIWDMAAAPEDLRNIDDMIERMRDPSHVRILSKEEFTAMYADGFNIEKQETISVPMNLNSWMDTTDTPEETRKEITKLMEAELNGGEKTGFFPYISGGEIWFDHHWMLTVGVKI